MTLDPTPNPIPEPTPLPPAPPYPKPPNPLRFLLTHNPIFLLSALSMFLGCFLINSALDVRTGDTTKLLALLAAINLYEITLLVLGITLLRRSSFHRDGTLLLLIQMLFLTDAPFLLAQSAMANAHWLSNYNILLLAAAIAKSFFALRALKIPLRPRTLGFLFLQLTLIYCALPLFFSHVAKDGIINANPMYLAWWIVGLLPLAYDLLARLNPLPNDITPQQKFLRRAYIILPWLFLIAHLGFFQYAYRAPFCLADLSPILLGLTIATLRLRPSKYLPLTDLRLLRILLPAVAIAFSFATGNAAASPTLLTLSPKWLNTALALITYAYCLNIRLTLIPISLFSLIALLHYFGPSPETVANKLSAFYTSLYNFLSNHIPQTATAWGILSILTAFALLALGAYRSLRSSKLN